MRTAQAILIGLVIVVVAAGAVLLGGAVPGGGGTDRYRFFVATPDPFTSARLAPHAGAAAGARYSSRDPVWVTCWVEGPRDDRYWYRLEDGSFLPEDVLFPERGDSGTPPRC